MKEVAASKSFVIQHFCNFVIYFFAQLAFSCNEKFTYWKHLKGMYCPSVRGDLKNDSNEKILLSEGGGGGCVAEKRISF